MSQSADATTGNGPPIEAAPAGTRADIKVGFACNNRCVFCAQGRKRSECTSIPLDELLRRLQQVYAPGRGLVLTGGEPMLHKDLLKVVTAARRMGYFPVQIQTNGRLFAYPELLQAYLRAGASEFSPSLHGSVAAVHESLTRAPGSWSQSVAGIANLVKAGCTVVTNSVVVRRNVHDVPALVKLLAHLGVSQAQLAYVHPVGTALEMFDEVVPRLPDVVEPIRSARDIARAAGLRLVTEAVPYCFLRGMEELSVEAEIPDTTVVDLAGQVAHYSDWRVVEGKSHGPPCERCAVRRRCEGPWREYPEKFGWDEFEPVPEDPFARIDSARRAAPAAAC